MGVVDTLNALDEKAGVAGPAKPRAWDKAVRRWWVGPVAAVVVTVGATALSLLSDGPVHVSAALPVIPLTFWSGFFYNERLRALGRKPRYGRVPAGWPNETT